MSAPSFTRRMLRLGGLLVALSVVTPTIVSAQDAPRKELTEKVSTEVSKLQELFDAKQWDTALAKVDSLLADVRPESYDRTLLNQIKVQILLTQGKYAAAIEPLETALRLGHAYNFIEERQNLEFTQILSQLYFQEGTTTKDTRLRDDYLKKAYDTIKVYLAATDKPKVEAVSYAATMMYTQATLDAENPDKQLLAESKELAEKGLLLTAKPREAFYVLVLAALQQEGKNKEAGEILELLVTLNPTSKQFWQQLQATYLNIANAAPPDSQEALEYNVRTVITIERAQKLGILNSPRDHFNMVGILMNIRRFNQAIVLLEKGLANGDIDDTQQNWEYLASSYQQVNKELKAIDVLKQTAAKFPEVGSLEFKIANIYYGLDKLAEAYDHGKKALSKGGLENEGSAQMFVAYMGFELKKYDEALPFAKEAKDAGAVNADRLYEAIENAIKERQAALEATI